MPSFDVLLIQRHWTVMFGMSSQLHCQPVNAVCVFPNGRQNRVQPSKMKKETAEIPVFEGPQDSRIPSQGACEPLPD